MSLIAGRELAASPYVGRLCVYQFGNSAMFSFVSGSFGVVQY